MTCPHTPRCDPDAWVAAPPLPRPESFVNIASVIDSELAELVNDGRPVVLEEPGVTVDVQKNSFAIAVSRQMALDNGMIVPTACEREQMAADRVEYRRRREETQAKPGPDLTLASLLEALRVSPAYARHWLHPGCSCDPFDDDPYLCDWARELGFTDRRFDGGGIR